MPASPRMYFGDVDAAAEDAAALSRRYVNGSLLDSVIGPRAPDGATILVGLKGTGKTALGKVAMERFSGLKWFRNEKSRDLRFEVPSSNIRSGTLMGMIKVFIIEQLIEQLYRDSKLQRTEFEKFTKFFKNTSATFAKATEINAPFIKFKPGEFFNVEHQEGFDEAWDAAVGLLSRTIKKQEIFVVLDDVDSYFMGIEKSPRFIEGLCRAVMELNTVSAPKIYCLLLLKQGVWRTLFEQPEEYDKIKHYMEFIKWDLVGCAAVIGGRIASIHKMPAAEIKQFGDAVPFLRLEFDGDEQAIAKCFKEIFSFSVNGPRDVIDLCNNIRREYPTGKITTEMVLERCSNFSEEKLYAINADFGHIYPDMPVLIESIFRGFKASFKGSELSDHLDKNILSDPNINRQSFGKHHWFIDLTPVNCVKRLFDIGIVGVDRKQGVHLFSSESNTVSQNTLLNSDLIIHKAYQPALGFI
jgi:hypothetical protein